MKERRMLFVKEKELEKDREYKKCGRSKGKKLEMGGGRKKED